METLVSPNEIELADAVFFNVLNNPPQIYFGIIAIITYAPDIRQKFTKKERVSCKNQKTGTQEGTSMPTKPPPTILPECANCIAKMRNFCHDPDQPSTLYVYHLYRFRKPLGDHSIIYQGISTTIA